MFRTSLFLGQVVMMTKVVFAALTEPYDRTCFTDKVVGVSFMRRYINTLVSPIKSHNTF